MNRRQPSANDSNPSIHSGIPLPATVQKRRAPEHNAQPPPKSMRMSIAGGPGPSRPPQAFVPPVPQNAPRMSTYGSQPTSSQPNPLLMSARKDQSQFGRTPMRAGTQRLVYQRLVEEEISTNCSCPKCSTSRIPRRELDDSNRPPPRKGPPVPSDDATRSPRLPRPTTLSDP